MNCLILNLGTQEPRINVADDSGKKYLKLGEERDKKVIDCLNSLGIGEQVIGLYNRAAALLTRVEKRPELLDRLTFPITECCLDQYRRSISLLILVTTDSGSPRQTSNDPGLDDTASAGALLEAYLRRKDPSLKVKRVVLGANAHRYQEARRAVKGANLLTAEALREFQKIYLCQSPGLPMVNGALLRHLLHLRRRDVEAFQVEEPEQDHLTNGGISQVIAPVPERDILSDFLREATPPLLEAFDFRAAQALFQADEGQLTPAMGVAHKKLDEAVKRWEWDVPDKDPLVRCELALARAEALLQANDTCEGLRLAGDVAARLSDYSILSALGRLDWLDTRSLKREQVDDLKGSAPDWARPVLEKINNDFVLLSGLINDLSPAVKGHPVWGEVYKKLERLQFLKAIRNRLTHRFNHCAEEEIPVPDFSARLREVLDQIAANEGRSLTPTSFPAIGEEIKTLLQREDDD